MRRAEKAVGVLLAVLCCFICLLAFFREIPISDRAVFHPGNLKSMPSVSEEPIGLNFMNTADGEELQEISGIGPKLAQSILDERSLHGLFYYPEDLTQIKGIGKQKLNSLLSWIRMKQ